SGSGEEGSSSEYGACHRRLATQATSYFAGSSCPYGSRCDLQTWREADLPKTEHCQSCTCEHEVAHTVCFCPFSDTSAARRYILLRRKDRLNIQRSSSQSD